MNNQYFASLPIEEIVTELEKKVDDYYTDIDTSGKRQLWIESNKAYNAAVIDGATMWRSGDNEKYHRININHYRNIIQHLINLTITQRPAFEPRAANSDVKSQSQTILARGLLDYYMRVKRLEVNFRTAVEHSLVFGEGFISTTWNATAGEMFAVDPDTEIPEYTGDIEFSNFEPLNVIRDVNTQSWADNKWIITRRLVNKYELAAKYPNLGEEIRNVVTTYDPMRAYNSTQQGTKVASNTDLIEVFDFYHERSEAMPNGRFVSYVDSEIVLIDVAMPYRTLPLFRITSSDLVATSHGYSPAFDLLPLQEAINDLYSIIATNQLNLGVQNILVPIGSQPNPTLIEGMNYITYDKDQGKPEPLNLVQTAPEIFNFIGQLEHTMETLSGVNSVTRGTPEASLKSGAALALVQSMAIQSSAQLQQSYVQLLEGVGTSMINILQDFASAPRIAEIAGKNNRGLMRSFTKEDLSAVNRVTVDIGNPMTRTTAGKVELAQTLLQANLIDNADSYLQVVQTGSLDPMTEGKTLELLAIKAENEKMADGDTVMAMITDDHVTHITEHKAIISDPIVRMTPSLVEIVTNHIIEHYKMLSDPQYSSLLELLGQKPIAAPQQPQAPQGNGNNPIPMTMADNVQQMLPDMPQMPKNPMTGQRVEMPPTPAGAPSPV